MLNVLHVVFVGQIAESKLNMVCQYQGNII